MCADNNGVFVKIKFSDYEKWWKNHKRTQKIENATERSELLFFFKFLRTFYVVI